WRDRPREWRPGAGGERPSHPASATLLDHDLSAFVIEVESHFGETGLPHRVTQPGLFLRIEHEETTATRADQLAPDSAVADADVIIAFDARVRDADRARARALPVLVHELAETGEVARLQRLLRAQPQVLHKMQVVDHCRIVLLGPDVLVLEDLHGRTRKPG